jgi:hypothetical protein
MEEALGGSTFDRQLRALAFPGLQDLHQQPLWARSSAATTSAFVDPSAAALFGALGPHSLHAALNGGGSGGAAAAGGKVSPTPTPWAPLVVQQQLQQGVPAAAPVQPVALCVQPVALQAQPSPGMLKDPQGSKVRRLHHCVLCPIHLWLLLCSSAPLLLYPLLLGPLAHMHVLHLPHPPPSLLSLPRCRAWATEVAALVVVVATAARTRSKHPLMQTTTRLPLALLLGWRRAGKRIRSRLWLGRAPAAIPPAMAAA